MDKAGKTDLANEYLMKALKANPGGPSINFNVGLYFLNINQPEKALYHFKTSLNDKKLKQRTLLYSGIAYQQKGWLGEATTIFQQAVSLDGKNITPHLHLAEIYYRTGNKKMSQREASTLVNLMLHDEALFYKTIDLIAHDGHLGNVQLSADLLLPLISEACDNESKELTKWKDYIEETLEKRARISDNSGTG